VRIRARATRTRGERMLRRLGVRVIVRNIVPARPHDEPLEAREAGP